MPLTIPPTTALFAAFVEERRARIAALVALADAREDLKRTLDALYSTRQQLDRVLKERHYLLANPADWDRPMISWGQDD